MRSFPRSLSLVILAASGLSFAPGMAASAAPPARDAPFYATIKPGAAVEFSHRIDGATKVGDIGTAVVTVAEDYDSGSLRLIAHADEGLELVSGENIATLSMAGAGKKVVNIRFRVLSEGVHYLSLTGEASDRGGQKSFRSTSMRVQIGNAPAKAVNPALAKDGKGQAIILMRATETIRK